MQSSLNKTRIALALGFSVAVLLVSALLINHPIIESRPEIMVGITFDIAILLPAIYLFLIWNSGLSRFTVVPVFIISLVIASFLIPANQQYHLDLIKTILIPIVEISVISLIIWKVRKSVKVFKNQQGNDWYDLLRQTSLEMIENERVARIFSTEIGMIYYAVFHWRRNKPLDSQYTGYKNNGVTAILIAVIFLIITETVILHIVLLNYIPIISWIIFVLSVYTTIQILGHLKALRSRYTEIASTSLKLKYGLYGDSTILFEDITSVKESSTDLESEKFERLALLGPLESHNVVLRLKEPSIIEKVYGIKKRSKIILFYLDEPKLFIEEINKHIVS